MSPVTFDEPIREPILGTDQMYHRANLVAEAQVASLIGSIIAPGANKITGMLNAATGLILPSPGETINSYIRGWVSPQLAAWALGRQGINIGQLKDRGLKGINAGNDDRAKLWGAIIEMNRLRPDIGLYLRAYFRRLIGPAEMTKAYQTHGVVKEEWEKVLPAMRSWPSPDLASAARNRGMLEQNEYAELISLATGERDDCQILRQKMRQIEQLLGPAEYSALLNRNQIAPVDYHNLINRKTGLSDESIRQLDELRKTMPGMGEVIQIYARANNANLLGLTGEWNPEIRNKWGAWAGESHTWQAADPAGGAPSDVTWPELRWQAHWRSPGWMELREMLWRQEDMADKLGDEEVRAWLDREGVPEKIRNRMMDLRYVPVSIRYLKTMWQQNIIDTPFAERQLRAAGNDPRVVDFIIASWIKEQQQKAQKSHEAKQAECAKQIIKAIESDIELGLLDVESAGKELASRGLNPEDWPDCFLAATQRRLHRLKAAILAKVKNLYMTGGLDLEGAAKELIAQGFTQNAAVEYLQAWTDELSLEARQVAGQSVAQWYRLGLLPAHAAAAQLGRLGFASPDTALLLLSADEAADKLAIDAVQSLSPGNRVAASSVVRLLKTSERMRKQAQMTLRRLFPVSRIKREYLALLRSEEWARDKLANIGEDLESRDNYLAEWNAAIEAKQSKAKPAPKAAVVPLPQSQPISGISDTGAGNGTQPPLQ